jgi:hypothetical protein
MKKIMWVLSGAALLAFVWYLFIVPYEFQVNFKIRTLPGDIIQIIRIWDRSLEGATVTEVDSVFGLKQNITWESRSYRYHWRFKSESDSTTSVNVRIAQPGRSLLNKLLVPFTDQPIEKDAGVIARNVYEILKTHLQITNVKVVGESETRPSFCVCRTLRTKQIEKANGMMKDYGLLTSFIGDFNLKVDGVPLLKVREWNHTQGKLKFDFCFPIAKDVFLPKSDSVSYQQFGKQKALKAVYHGNYITSDRAWYELTRFAQSKGYEPDGLPIEYFFNNPNLGLDEEEWKAEIYLPIK